MPKEKTKVAQYRFVQTVSYAPLADKEYPADSMDALLDWDAAHVENALRAGLIEVVTAGDDVPPTMEELATPLPEQLKTVGKKVDK